jgi:hypothetical protein
LFQLEEQRVVGRASFAQHEVHPHPDAADADDLTHPVDDREPVEEMPAVVAQAHAVPLEHGLHHLGFAVGTDADPSRRVLDDPRVPVDDLRQLLVGAATGPLARFLFDDGCDALARGRVEHLEQLVDGDQVVPDVEFVRVGVALHAFAIAARCHRDRVVDGAGRQADLAREHDQARHEPLHVPLERSAQRLVEIAQVE